MAAQERDRQPAPVTWWQLVVLAVAMLVFWAVLTGAIHIAMNLLMTGRV